MLQSRPMNIFMVHNRYRDSGGEDLSFRMEVDMLRRNGCHVETLVEDNERVAQLGQVRTAMRSIWSPEIFQRVRIALRNGRFDVLHVQNFFPLISPSVYYAARAEGVPVVQSLRNYRLICPAGTFYRDGRICEDCLGRTIPWPGVQRACYRNSVFGSSVVGGMLAVNHGLGTWFRLVDAYIAMTETMRDKFVQGGFPPEKIFVKSNFLDPDPLPGSGDGNFALFVGRLSQEKGIATLLKAWETAGPDIPLKILGTGPLKDVVTASAGPAVEFLGWQSEEEVLRLMGLARFIVIPTEWYEGHPRTAVEALARGLPIIASRIGAMTEMIEDGRSGLLFTAGDADDLAAKLRWALVHGERMAEMGREGRNVYTRRYTASANYPQLRAIYQHAIAARRIADGASSAERHVDRGRGQAILNDVEL